MGTNGHYWRQAGLLTLASILPLLWFKYVSCRRRVDLRPGLWGSLTYPVYKQLYSLVSIIGAIRSVVFYIGGHNMPKTIRQMVKEQDPQAFWLDPRFENNPGFLADEGEAKSAAAQTQEVQCEEKYTPACPVIGMPPSVFARSERTLYSSPAISTMSLDYMAPAQPRMF
jgi:hypothetical protein